MGRASRGMTGWGWIPPASVMPGQAYRACSVLDTGSGMTEKELIQKSHYMVIIMSIFILSIIIRTQLTQVTFTPLNFYPVKFEDYFTGTRK